MISDGSYAEKRGRRECEPEEAGTGEQCQRIDFFM
jgi:hypothetical protein